MQVIEKQPKGAVHGEKKGREEIIIFV